MGSKLTSALGSAALLLLLCAANGCETPVDPVGTAHLSVSHALFDSLLLKHVSPKGEVDYAGFQNDSAKFNQYLTLLSDSTPGKGWSEDEQLAYWINTYNAFTIKLIADNYPIESITDLHPTLYIPGKNTVWHEKFFSIGGQPTNLDHIEHETLRKDFEEPRIHFVIVCASRSCPKLRNSAYTADSLEVQLSEQTREFLLDTSRNKLSAEHLQLSKIFKWFKEDFTKGATLPEFIEEQSGIQINQDAEIDYLDYDWALNGKGSASP